MVPDMLIANLKFLQDLPPEERQVFDEAAEVCNRAERESWSDAVAVSYTHLALIL